MAVIIAPLPDENPYPGLNLEEASRPVDIRRVVNNLLLGQMNNVIEFSYPESAGVTATVQDIRIQPHSFISIMNVAGTPTFRIAAVRQGECDITWTGAAGWGSRSLSMVVIG